MTIKLEGGRKLKYGLKLTKAEKILLNSEGYNPEDYLRTKKAAEYLQFINVKTNKILEIRY